MNSVNWPAVGAVALPNVGGYISSYFVRDATKNWYEVLKTPDWRPPRIAFPIVWTSLYTGMGFASYLVWIEETELEGAARLPLAMYGVQLALNLAWSPVFFGMKSIKGGFGLILLIDAAAAATAWMFYNVTPTAGYIMVPYLVWLSIATTLNYCIMRDNPDPPKITEIKSS